MIRRALLSVWDKTGLVDLGCALTDAGVEIISTGGTARALEQAGLPVRTVEDVTGFPEVLGGRVKTLHPAVHAGILARREPVQLDELDRLGLAPIDLVVVNLYPFAQTVARPGCTLEEAVEQIDIGGVTLLRAAAKNFEGVVVLCRPEDYSRVADAVRQGQDLPTAERKTLAVAAFAHTAAYDAAIHAYLTGADADAFPPTLDLHLERVSELRYGENPHQQAALYRLPGTGGLTEARLLHGKALSYNNLLDLDAAWAAAQPFDGPSVAIIKHNNPSGLATAGSLAAAYRAAYECDPLSAYGGIVACNRQMDAETAAAIADIFVEAVIAPSFHAAALGILQRKKDLRILEMGPETLDAGLRLAALDMRRISGGLLVQDRDRFEDAAGWRVVTERAPTPEEIESLAFAWKVAAHVKSNAIVLARGTATVGVGAGQMSRIDSTEIAIKKAGPERCRGAVLASDAYFPFPDNLEAAGTAGITAAIEPGGSIRDKDAIAVANKYGMAMVFTGTRHFRH